MQNILYFNSENHAIIFIVCLPSIQHDQTEKITNEFQSKLYVNMLLTNMLHCFVKYW